MKRTTILTDEGVVDAVVGYRTWIGGEYIVEGKKGLWLKSVYRDTKWPQHLPLKSECLCPPPSFPFRAEAMQVPAHVDKCGIHAWRESIPDQKTQVTRWRENHFYVHGEIYLWGKVRVFERGYRAEYGMPGCFYISDNMTDYVKQRTSDIAEVYGVLLAQTPPNQASLDGELLEPWNYDSPDEEFFQGTVNKNYFSRVFEIRKPNAVGVSVSMDQMGIRIERKI